MLITYKGRVVDLQVQVQTCVLINTSLFTPSLPPKKNKKKMKPQESLALIVWILLQIRGYNDGGWFTLYPNFGETANAGPPYFFKVLSYVSIPLYDCLVMFDF